MPDTKAYYIVLQSSGQSGIDRGMSVSVRAVAQSCLSVFDLIAHRALLSLELSSQEYWSGEPLLIAYREQCRICNLRRREISFGIRDEASGIYSFMWQKFHYREKATEKAPDTESAPPASLIKAFYILFSWY